MSAEEFGLWLADYALKQPSPQEPEVRHDVGPEAFLKAINHGQ